MEGQDTENKTQLVRFRVLSDRRHYWIPEPKSSEDAKKMNKFPMDYVQCPECTHVWNASFSYDSIPYQTNPSRMFNHGYIWQGFLTEVRKKLVSKLKKDPVIIEIGCGEGHFLRGISEALAAQGRFLGFDPDVSGESGLGIEFQARLFDPFLDVLPIAFKDFVAFPSLKPTKNSFPSL